MTATAAIDCNSNRNCDRQKLQPASSNTAQLDRHDLLSHALLHLDSDVSYPKRQYADTNRRREKKPQVSLPRTPSSTSQCPLGTPTFPQSCFLGKASPGSIPCCPPCLPCRPLSSCLPQRGPSVSCDGRPHERSRPLHFTTAGPVRTPVRPLPPLPLSWRTGDAPSWE